MGIFISKPQLTLLSHVRQAAHLITGYSPTAAAGEEPSSWLHTEPFQIHTLLSESAVQALPELRQPRAG